MILLLLLLACLPDLERRDVPDDPAHDWDGDGFTEDQGDCADEDATLNPQTPWALDGDGDGFGATGEVQASCLSPGEGWTRTGDDCDDTDDAVHPGADERCNEADDDCDGDLDEDPVDPATFYPDTDGDGFGATAGAVVTCAPPDATFIARAGDCDDGDGDVHPEATEYSDDTVDSDCDDAPDAPCGQATWRVGPGFLAETVAGALADAAVCDGDTIEVRATDETALVLDRDVTLRGELTLTGDGITPLVTMSAGTLQGFTLTGGAPCVLVVAETEETAADVVLRDLVVEGCAADHGGGVGLFGTWVTARLEGVDLTGNEALSCGGNLAASGARVTLVESRVRFGSAEEAGGEGGGVCLSSGGLLTVQDTEIGPGNVATIRGGGLAVVDADVALSGVTLHGNTAADGGGAFLLLRGDVPAVLTDVVLRGNSATDPTGASQLATSGGSFTLERVDARGGTGGRAAMTFFETGALQVRSVVVAGNTGDGIAVTFLGGGQVADLRNVTLLDNTGAGLASDVADLSEVTLTSSLVGHHAAGIAAEGVAPELSYVAFWDNGADGGTGTVLTEAPHEMLRFFHPDLDPALWDLHPVPGSPLLDAGDPSPLHDDPDGTRGDLGATGGSVADATYTADADADGLWDGWEARWDVDDPAADPDADTLSTLAEFTGGTLPHLADSDDDGCRDDADPAPADPTTGC